MLLVSVIFVFELNKHGKFFPESFNKADASFSLIHCDVWGPYRTASSSGVKYFLTIVDDYSRAVCTYLMLEKAEVSTLLKSLCAMTDKQFGHYVKTVRSDNGIEFMVLKPYFTIYFTLLLHTKLIHS